MLAAESAHQILNDLRHLSSMHDDIYEQELLALEEMLTSHTYKLAVIGEFSVGKSTFLNALIGKEILYSSNAEATGSIICIEHGVQKKATITHDDDQHTVMIDLSTKDGIRELTDFVDINRADNASRVYITYPFPGFEKGIMLIDTPGLGGFSPEQAKLTKRILKEANGTILLISHKGLERTELDLLTEKNSYFGKLETKELFVIINQIGLYYESRTKEEAARKIEALIQGVKQEFDQHGVSISGLFAVDSQDFLWSQDTELYDRLVSLYEHDPTAHMLSRDEYRERSNFLEFKQYLISNMLQGNQHKLLMQDVQHKLGLLVEAFLELTEVQRSQSLERKDHILATLQLQKEALLENRRKLYNGLSRYLRETMDTFLESAEQDVIFLKAEREKDAARIADASLERWEDVEDKKVENSRDQLDTLLRHDYSKFQGLFTEQLQWIGNVLIGKKMSSDLSALLKSQISVTLDFAVNSFQFELKKEEIKLVESEFLEEDREELAQLREQIKLTERELEKLRFSEIDFRLRQIDHDRIELKHSFNGKLQELGTQPEPRPVYRTVTRKRKKWIIFTDQYQEKVFDHLDNSAVQKWIDKKDVLFRAYMKKEKELDEKSEAIQHERRKVQLLEKRLKELFAQEAGLKEDILRSENELKKKYEENKRSMLAQKKLELYKRLRSYSQHRLQELVVQMEEHASIVLSAVKEHMKINLHAILDRYAKEMEEEIDRIGLRYSEEQQRLDSNIRYAKLVEHRRVLNEF